MWRSWKASTLWWECKEYVCMESSMAGPHIMNIRTTIDLIFLLKRVGNGSQRDFGIHPCSWQHYSQWSKGRSNQCLLMDEWINKLWSIHTVDSREEVYSVEMDSILDKYIYNDGKFYVQGFYHNVKKK